MSATLQPVNCNNCGAPLEVAAGTNFVTCGHCGTRLAVKRTASSVFTEALEAVAENTTRMTRQLAEIAYRAELERIDREWEAERRGFLTTDKEGNAHEPSSAGSVVGGLFAVGFGLFWTVFTVAGLTAAREGSHGPPGFFYLFSLVGVAIAAGGIWSMATEPAKAEQFANAKAAYQKRRAAVTVEQFMGEPRGSD